MIFETADEPPCAMKHQGELSKNLRKECPVAILAVRAKFDARAMWYLTIDLPSGIAIILSNLVRVGAEHQIETVPSHD